MHIGFVSLDYPSHRGGGGVGSQVRTLGQALVQAGHQVTVIALSQPGSRSTVEQDDGIKVYRIPAGGLHWFVSKFPVLGSALTLAIRELENSWVTYRQVSKLHHHNPFDVIEGIETGALWLALKLPHVPLVVRLHGDKYTFHKYTPDLSLPLDLRLSRVLQRIAMRRARLLISPSRAHAHEIAVEIGADRPPIEVVPNTVGPSPIDGPQSLPDHLHEDSRNFVVLFVGRIERVKGIPNLLHAAHRVVQEIPNVRFMLAGAYHPTLAKHDLDRLVHGLALAEHVHFLGHVPHQQLAALYRRADVCLLPSYYETFGIAALEAMAFGRPVVGTTAGGLPEVIENGASGLLVQPGNPGALAGAMTRLLHDPELRERLGKAGRERASRHFGVKRDLDTSLELYKWTVNTMTAPPADVQHIFFSPHFDDVVLSCGGFVDALVHQGKKTKVVTVFTEHADSSGYSAFARHLHAKWRTGNSTREQRSSEDEQALAVLGVQQIEHWDFLEAPYRRDASGCSLYASYDELRGRPAADDHHLIEVLSTAVQRQVEASSVPATLYFPLSLGRHVDHQILFLVGIRLRAMGYAVRFYEDWPYLESYNLRPETLGWRGQTVDIVIEPKVSAARCYSSQLHGLGGSAEALERRMTESARQVGNGCPQERYWEVLPGTAMQLADGCKPELPFQSKQKEPSLADFRHFLNTLRWRHLDEILPVGNGYCLDIGCGDSRHRPVIEERGYDWVGLDIVPPRDADPALKGDLQQIAFRSHKAAAVVAWQVMEYVEQPEQVIAEVARVLEPGGAFCGSVSFLEPVHGRTLYGMSPLLLEQLLRKHGFVDIHIRPGLSGFALMLWTWLRRWGGPATGRLAVPATVSWLAPLAAARFLTSWVALRVGRGTGHGMRWTTEIAPLEFAGHVMFVARQPGRGTQCTSAS